MEKASRQYLDTLRERRKMSRAHFAHQLAGTTIAELLRDMKHIGLYIKLAKEHDANDLLRIAKDIAVRPGIKNRGAYFMRMMKLSPPKRQSAEKRWQTK